VANKTTTRLIGFRDYTTALHDTFYRDAEVRLRLPFAIVTGDFDETVWVEGA
jgi:hypothetical protein